jgi:hypothetical protein
VLHSGNEAGRVVHLLLLLVYLPLLVFIARGLPKLTSRQAASWIRIAIVALGLLELARYVFFANWIFELSATMAAIVTVVALGYAGSRQSSDGRGTGFLRVVPVIFSAAFAWMCAGSLISWHDALEWIASSPITATVMILSIALCAFGLRSGTEAGAHDFRIGWLDYSAIAFLTLLSFRTAPLAGIDAWSSLIVPLASISRKSAPSFWLLQSAVLAVVATVMYLGLRNIGSKWVAVPFSLIVTAATLFFVPLSGERLAAVQTIPSSGPLRVVWCFILVWFIGRSYFISGEQQQTRRFVFIGTSIWLGAVLWSTESAGYATAIWAGSLAVFTAQRTVAWRDKRLSRGDTIRRVVQILATPAVALAAVVIVITAAYFLLLETVPNWSSYLQSAPSSPAAPDPTGPVWYLLIVFGALSIVGAMMLGNDWMDARVVPLAGVWTGFWAVSRFFVITNEPARVWALIPLSLFMVALAIRLMRSHRSHRWHRIVIAGLVPAFAMPVAIVLGHGRLMSEITRPQVLPSRITLHE